MAWWRCRASTILPPARQPHTPGEPTAWPGSSAVLNSASDALYVGHTALSRDGAAQLAASQEGGEVAAVARQNPAQLQPSAHGARQPGSVGCRRASLPIRPTRPPGRAHRQASLGYLRACLRIAVLMDLAALPCRGLRGALLVSAGRRSARQSSSSCRRNGAMLVDSLRLRIIIAQRRLLAQPLSRTGINLGPPARRQHRNCAEYAMTTCGRWTVRALTLPRLRRYAGLERLAPLPPAALSATGQPARPGHRHGPHVTAGRVLFNCTQLLRLEQRGLMSVATLQSHTNGAETWLACMAPAGITAARRSAVLAVDWFGWINHHLAGRFADPGLPRNRRDSAWAGRLTPAPCTHTAAPHNQTLRQQPTVALWRWSRRHGRITLTCRFPTLPDAGVATATTRFLQRTTGGSKPTS